MIRVASLTVAGLILTTAAAQAQTAPSTAPAAGAQASAGAAPTAGATVYGSDGQPLGTVDSVTGSAVVLNTGTAKVAVPPTSIGKGAKGLTMAMTKQQLDAAQAQQQQQTAAAVQSKLTPGTTVLGLNGAQAGTIKAADAQYVTLTVSSNGRDAKLPVSGFSANAQGQVVIGMTAEQLTTATGGAAGGTAATTTTTSTAAPAGSAADTGMSSAAAPTSTGTPATATQTTTTSTSTTKKSKR